MKKLLLAMLLVAGCNSSPAVEEPPPQLIPDGFTFEANCQIHENHLFVVESSEIVRMYNLTNDMGETAQVPEDVLIEGLTAMGIEIPKSE